MASDDSKAARLFVGVDVGGTKILAALVKRNGKVLARNRCSTPHKGGGKAVLKTVAKLVDDLLAGAQIAPEEVSALGLAVPGAVDPDRGLVTFAPNVGLVGVEVVPPLQEALGIPIFPGNDVNLGTLGEKWLGSARHATNVVGLFPGTGIGGGVIINGRLVRGAREAGGEIGHMIMQIDGPVCGCGQKGCLEALASRTAIERDIRAAIASGRKSIVADLLDDHTTGKIRSGVLKEALAEGDEVVTEVLTKAARVLGLACLSIRHVLDPEVIVLGGGVMEACGPFLLPIIEEVVAGETVGGVRDGGKVLLSALGDDAVVLGAVALAMQSVGRDPFVSDTIKLPEYPEIQLVEPGRVRIGGSKYEQDVYVRADGKARQRKKPDGETIEIKTLEKAIKGGPEVLFLAAEGDRDTLLPSRGEALLRYRGVELVALGMEETLTAYNECLRRKAILVRPNN